MTKMFLTAVAVAGTVALTGCTAGDHSREDAHSSGQGNVDKTAPHVIAFNNHYPNVETKCDGFGHRLFVQTHDSAKGQNVIVLPDPTCPGFVKGSEPSVAATP